MSNTDQFGLPATDSSVDKQIMKIKRLDLSKLNSAIQEEIKVNNNVNKELLDYN